MNRSVDEVYVAVPAVPVNVPVVRHAVRGYLSSHGVPEERVGDVLLAVTEACTNVVRHAYRDRGEPGNLEISASIDGDGLSVCVADHGLGFAPRVDSPGLGLGVPLMAALADDLAIRPSSDNGGTEVVMRFAVS